jgi:hypothetical protein
LKTKGFSVLYISQHLGVSRQAIYKSISCNPCSSRRIRLYISFLLDIPPSQLFLDLPPRVVIIDDYEFMIAHNS